MHVEVQYWCAGSIQRLLAMNNELTSMCRYEPKLVCATSLGATEGPDASLPKVGPLLLIVNLPRGDSEMICVQ